MGESISPARGVSLPPAPLHHDAPRREGFRSDPPRATRETKFVGRTAELEAIGAELARVRAAKNARIVVVRGESGIGKTALVEQVDAHLRTLAPDVAVFHGRGVAADRGPYASLDAIAGALTSAFQSMSRAEVARVAPRDVALLLAVFPVLGRVEAFRATGPVPDTPKDANEERRRAFTALRALLARLTESAPIVVVLDDAQWCDADAIDVLRAVVSPPDAPALLLVLATPAWPLSSAPRAADWRCPVTFIELGPLDPEAARDATAAAGEDGKPREGGASHDAGHFARVRCLVACEGPIGAARIDEAIASEIAELSSRSRLVLELLAVAAAPVSQRVIAAAARVPVGELGGPVAALREKKLAKLEREGGIDLVTCAHERVRARVVATLDETEARARHAAFAAALDTDDARDLTAIASHYWAAGDAPNALLRWTRASRRAADRLAFEAAASLLRRILAHDPSLSGDRRKDVLIDLAKALAGAGDGQEAARAYLDAIEDANAAERIDIQRDAATLLLRTGRIDEGFALLARLLGTVGLSLPRPGVSGMLNAGWNRLRLRMRGYDFTAREERQVPQRTLRMLDALGAAYQSTAFLSGAAGVGLQTRHLREALDAGEPHRIARALLGEIGYLAIYGLPAASQTDRAIAAASAVVARLDDGGLRASLAGMKALSTYNRGDFVRALDQFERAISEMRLLPPSSHLHEDIGLLEVFRLYTLGWLGRARELGRSRELLVANARDRGDLWAASLAELAGGEHLRLWTPDLAETNAAQDAAIVPWKAHLFGFPHLLHMTSQVNQALCERRGADAVALLVARRRDVTRARLLAAQMLRATNRYSWGRALLSRGVRADEGRVLSLANALTREGVPFAQGNGAMLRAVVAFRRRARDVALREVEVAEGIYARTSSECALFVARALRARVLGGEPGAKLAAEVEHEGKRIGVRRPELVFPFLGLPGDAL